jgi:hypothetical protein
VLQCQIIHYKSHTQSAGSDPKTVISHNANHLLYLRLLISESIGFYHYAGQHITTSTMTIIQQITQNEHQEYNRAGLRGVAGKSLATPITDVTGRN